ncbi:MAG: ABC transporter substrate-binding protein [Pseudomonadales bacterium]|nr:ABC transporter substrate-binding protein [Pseudomonadales bacterium]
MVRFKHGVVLLALLTLAMQTTAGDFKIGIAQWSGYPDSVEGFKAGLSESGLIEGENVEFNYAKIGGNQALQIKETQRLLDENVDLIYSLTTPGTTIVKNLSPPTLPIVFSIVTYPADSGLIESFEYSGNNLVGTSNYVRAAHFITLLKLILPNTKTVAIFHRKGEPNSKIQASNLIRLFKRSGIKSIDVEVETAEEVSKSAISLVGKAEVFITTTDTLMQSGGEKELIKISNSHKIPILSSNKNGIDSGSTFGAVSDFYTLGKMSGLKAAEILKNNTKPSRIETEVQNPPLFLGNRSAMKRLGIKLSDRAAAKIVWSQ